MLSIVFFSFMARVWIIYFILCIYLNYECEMFFSLMAETDDILCIYLWKEIVIIIKLLITVKYFFQKFFLIHNILYTSVVMSHVCQCFNWSSVSVCVSHSLSFFRFRSPRHMRFIESKLVLEKPVCLPCSLVSLWLLSLHAFSTCI